MFVWVGTGIWTDWVIGWEVGQTLSKQRLRHLSKASLRPFKASDTLPEVTDTEPQDENLAGSYIGGLTIMVLATDVKLSIQRQDI